MSQTSSESSGHVLVIESNPDNAAAIERALGAHITIVPCIEDALASIATRVPDVILTSTFLRPADDMRLRDHLRRRVEMAHTQVVTLPQFVETIESEGHTPAASSGPGTMLRILGKRQSVPLHRCDARMLREQVEKYLEHAEALRCDIDDRQRNGLARVFAIDNDVTLIGPWPGTTSTALVPANRSDSGTRISAFSLPRDRRRVTRRRADDLGGMWGITLPDGEARILDISPLGVSLETSSQLYPGRLIQLQLVGLERNVSVRARLVRSEVTDASGPHVRYRVAAAFLRKIDLSAETAPALAVHHPPKVLAEVLGRVLANANWASNGAGLCSTFEAEVGRLLPLREVRIRTAAVISPPDCQSICFDIPGSPQLTLQAIFEPRHQPLPVEIHLLEAAANLAPVVLALTATPEPAAQPFGG